MINKQLINKYAKALYAVAQKANSVPKTSLAINQLCDCIKDISELNHLLSSQRIDKDTKKRVISNIFENICNKIEFDLIMILIDNNDISLLNDISKKYNYLAKLNSDEMNATITSSVELSHDELDKIKDKIRKVTGKKVNLESQVDSNLLGGIKLRSENIIIDNSLKFRLNKIKESLIKS